MQTISPLFAMVIILSIVFIILLTLAPLLSYFRLVSIQGDLRRMQKENEAAKKELEKQTQLLANMLAIERSRQ